MNYNARIYMNQLKRIQMAAPKYTAPTIETRAFNCPLCSAYASQVWSTIYRTRPNGSRAETPELRTSECVHCGGLSVWYNGSMLYPSSGNAPLPSADLPADILADYEEARSINTVSPRGAAALLRLAIQKLCKDLGEKGKNIDEDIAALVRKGLPVRVQQALDAVRVIGNEAVHPGTIDLRDSPEIAASLFGLVNFIVEKMITEPKEIDVLYAYLPESKKDAIKRRDE